MKLDKVSIQDNKNRTKYRYQVNELPNPLVAVDNSWEMMRTLLGDTSRRSLALAALSEPECSGDPTAASLVKAAG
jgi:hypothetical protein